MLRVFHWCVIIALASLAPLALGQSPPELQHYELLRSLRAKGFTCPGGRSYPPNSGEFLFDCRAWRAAKAHAEDMASRRYFSHLSPEGKSPCDRSNLCSENIAAGQATAQAALSSGTNEKSRGSTTACCHGGLTQSTKHTSPSTAHAREATLERTVRQARHRDGSNACPACLQRCRRCDPRSCG